MATNNLSVSIVTTYLFCMCKGDYDTRLNIVGTLKWKFEDILNVCQKKETRRGYWGRRKE